VRDDACYELQPDKGYDDQAAEWRAKLDEEATKPRSDEGT